MLTRRELLERGGALAAMTAMPRLPAQLLGGSPPPRPAPFRAPLPLPRAAVPVAPGEYRLALRATTQELHPDLPATAVWGYDDGHGASYPGPTIEVRRGEAVTVSYANELPERHLLPVDTAITEGFGTSVRTLSHLHGGFVSAADDGNPDLEHHGYSPGQVQTVHYPNQQRASMLWYHDHADSITRLNVYAGLAGLYLVRDDRDTGEEPNPLGIPGGRYEIPIVLQDRKLRSDGSLFYSPGPKWIPEFFGDTPVVNGAVSPFLEVEPRRYRLRFLNGSNARFYNLEIGRGPEFVMIGSEGGRFDRPVRLRRILLLPAERADTIVDFGPFAGRTLTLRNVRLPRDVSSPGPPLPELMRFRVGRRVTRRDPGPPPRRLRGGSRPHLSRGGSTRDITLEEIHDAHDNPIRVVINGARFEDEATERPRAGAIEDWRLINLTVDSHPIHVHLVQFQVVDRRPLDVERYTRDVEAWRRQRRARPSLARYFTGPPRPPRRSERGWKDTVGAHPGFATRIRAKFDLPAGVQAPQRYVFHCHILEHEDNDMMRPYEVVA